MKFQKKTKIKLQLLCLIVFILFPCGYSMLTTADNRFGIHGSLVPKDTKAAEFAGQAFIINRDWFSTSAVEFNKQALPEEGKYRRLSIDKGGYGMTNFINHGEVAYDEDTDTHVFMAEMVFPFSYVLYTDCMISDVYAHRYYADETDWLWLLTYTSWFWKSDFTFDVYKTKWNGIEIYGGDTQTYEGPLKIHTVINPVLPIEEGDNITINGFKFKVPDIRIFTTSVTLVNRTYGVCDDPKNFYTEAGNQAFAIREASINSLYNIQTACFDDYRSEDGEDVDDACDDGWDSNDPNRGSKTAKSVINGLGIQGISTVYGVTYTSGQIGQGFASSPTVGSTWDKTNDLNPLDEEFDFEVNFRLKPNIFYDMQIFDVEFAAVYVDRYKESAAPDYGLCDVRSQHTDRFTRIIGLGVQNLFIKMIFEAKVTILMTVQPIGDESSTVLEDPVIYQSDILWDNTFYGTTKAEQEIVEPKNWLTDIGDWFENLWDDLTEWWDDAFGWWEDLGGLWSSWWWVIALIAVIIIVMIILYFVFKMLRKKKQVVQGLTILSGGGVGPEK